MVLSYKANHFFHTNKVTTFFSNTKLFIFFYEFSFTNITYLQDQKTKSECGEICRTKTKRRQRIASFGDGLGRAGAKTEKMSLCK